jgi:hypothetical protein
MVICANRDNPGICKNAQKIIDTIKSKKKTLQIESQMEEREDG